MFYKFIVSLDFSVSTWFYIVWIAFRIQETNQIEPVEERERRISMPCYVQNVHQPIPCSCNCENWKCIFIRRTWIKILFFFKLYIFKLFELKKCSQAVEQLNIKTKSFKDLLNDEPFARNDIIVLQDPHNLGKFNLTSFHHVKNNLRVETEGKSTYLNYFWDGPGEGT